MNKIKATKKIQYKFGNKHIDYMRTAATSAYNVAEGAVRAGKTVDNVLIFSLLLETTKDKFHLASGSTVGNAKLNIGACNGMGLENIFRGRCRWGKHLDNEALFVNTATGEKIIIFSGGGKADSFKSIRGNSYGYWIATEVDQHHKTFIAEALARQLMADDMKLFWDLNPSNPKHWIYTDYIDTWANKKMVGGYNYEHFTIYDNESLTEERKAEIASRYTPGTVEHSRSILGERRIAEGLIYKLIAEDENSYYIDYQQAKSLSYQYISIGVDIGGSNAKHTFVLSGITTDWKLIALRSVKIDADIDPETLADKYIKFVRKCLRDFTIQVTYFESAEQVLKRGFQSKSNKSKVAIPIVNSIKNEVNERINATNTLIAQKRFLYTENAETVKEALSEAMWCPKAAEKGRDERLDNGTTDIDTLDAFEYSFERWIGQLIERGRTNKEQRKRPEGVRRKR